VFVTLDAEMKKRIEAGKVVLLDKEDPLDAPYFELEDVKDQLAQLEKVNF
jgi:hypothetical protein